jgi:nicotinate-nucleotide adenylyltransferase
MNIGVLGGTFDPIHSGHLTIAEEARLRLNLGKVIFVPAGVPWLKSERNITPARHRVEMVRLAIEGRPYFELSTIEVERPGPSYSVDTIAALRQDLGPEYSLFFLLGWDSLAELPRWKDPARLVQMCRLVAVTRPGFSRPDLEAMEKLVPGVSESVVWLDIPPVDISSSDIRARIAAGLTIHGLVPSAVERYISRHRLYRDPAPEG